MPSVLPLLLRPLVDYCLRHSIAIGEVVESLKGVYVEAARAHLHKEGAAESASRISVMTGVHRKDTARLLQAAPVEKASRNLAARVIGAWRNSKRYCNASGKPRVLSAAGKDSEFASLVRSVNVDLNPYTVLFELERIGAVERARNGVRLATRLYTPRGDRAAGVSLLASDISDLMQSVEENIEQNGPHYIPNLHIKTEYDNIPDLHAEEVRAWCLREGSAFHQRVRNYLSQFDRDIAGKKTKDEGTIRVAVGAFSRIETLQQGEKK